MRKPPFSRRTFLRNVATVGALAPLAGVRSAWGQSKPSPIQGTVAVDSALNSKRVLSSTDFSYVGAFQVPLDVAGKGTAYSRGLTVRYVNGELRLVSMAYPDQVFEMAPPSVLAQAPGDFQTGAVTRVWGNVGAASYTKLNGPGSSAIYGLYWDQTDRRLYWNGGNVYDIPYSGDPSVGYSLLDDATGRVTSVGMWKVGTSSKMTFAGVTAIPGWFAQQYCEGRRLGAGFGGNWSGIAQGPASAGPALFAFNPPNISTQPTQSLLPSTNLVSYPYNATPYTTPDRLHRDPDVINDFDNWNPRDGVGYYTWTDLIWQNGVWIDTPTKSGFMLCLTLSNGRTWYQNSTIWAERASHAWYFYDPRALALVATGMKASDQIQPSERVAVQYPSSKFSYPLSGWHDEPPFIVTGTAYDPVGSRLYVAVRFGYGIDSSVGPVIYVYAVNG
jgi:hypothetical protein